MQADQPPLPRPEELLADYAKRLQRHRQGRCALWFHLSRLARENRHESDIQLAANLLTPLAKRHHGEIFPLASGDVVLCLRWPPEKEIEAALFDLKFSFAQDPLMKRADTEGAGVLLARYDMARHYETFLDLVEEAALGAPVAEALEQATQSLGPRLVLSRNEILEPKRGPVLSGHVNSSQGQIAVERLLERRDIGLFKGNGRPELWGTRQVLRPESLDAFDTLALAVARRQIEASAAFAEIERILLPSLCEHMLSPLAPNTVLVLRQDALMSPEFLLLDRELGEASRPWLALRAEEIADAGDTDYLAGFLRERGYRVGLTELALKDVPASWARIKAFDFAEVAYARELDSRDAELLQRLIDRFGGPNVILSSVRSQKALVIACRAGIRLASGPIVDDAL